MEALPQRLSLLLCRYSKLVASPTPQCGTWARTQSSLALLLSHFPPPRHPCPFCRKRYNACLALLALVCLGHITEAAAHISARPHASLLRRLHQDAGKPGNSAPTPVALARSASTNDDWMKEAANIWRGFNVTPTIDRAKKAGADGSLWAAAKATPHFPKRVNAALDLLAKMFPSEAQKINKHRQQLVQHIIRGTAPAPGSPLAKEQHTTTTTTTTDTRTPPDAQAAWTAWDCTFALINLAVVLVGRVMSFSGFRIPSKFNSTLTQNLAKLPTRVWDRVRILLKAVKTATTATAKASAIGSLVWEIISNALNEIIQAYRDSSSWSDWVITGAKIILQLGIFAAGGGLGAILKIVNLFYSALEVATSIMNAVIRCGA